MNTHQASVTITAIIAITRCIFSTTHCISLSTDLGPSMMGPSGSHCEAKPGGFQVPDVAGVAAEVRSAIGCYKDVEAGLPTTSSNMWW